MARLFFGDIPAEPTCSSCGASNPRYNVEDDSVYVCDEQCYVEWFVREKAGEVARRRFYDGFYEID